VSEKCQTQTSQELLKFSQSVQIALKLWELILIPKCGCYAFDYAGGKTMPARITVNLNAKGEFEIWLNPEGRDILVKELQGLSETNDHFHLGPQSLSEVEVSDRPYRSDDQLLMYGKILFRTDAWDAEFFPHVLDHPAPSR